jgi:Flp pilus assembly protein TadG
MRRAHDMIGTAPSTTGFSFSLGRFLREGAAVGAVEFALIFPVLLTIYFGAFEVTNLLVANRRVTAVAHTAGDLTAQAASVDNGDIADIFAASSAILAPFNTAPLTMRISSVVADANNVVKVAWSDGFQIGPRSVGSAVTLPAGLTTPGSSVVFVEVTYEYASPVSEMVASPISFSENAYLKPRRAVQITRTN